MAQPHVLGIEIGGTKLQLGLGAGDGQITALRRLKVDPAAGAQGILSQIADALGPLLESVGVSPMEIPAVGIGFGGPVDADRGIVTKSHQIAGWEGFRLADWVRETLHIRCVAIRNDADTAALAEARFGAGVGRSPILYVTIGSGIGGGLVIEGAIYRGSGGGAIEIGHLWVLDRVDRQPQLKRLETIASGWSIEEAARTLVLQMLRDGIEAGPMLRLAGGDPTQVSARIVAQAAAEGDGLASSILARAARGVGEALAQAVTLLAPRRIILGGGVSLIGEDGWFAPIRHYLDRLVFPPFRDTFDLVPAALGEEVVVHGALALAREAAATPQ